jgi:hypothetical protein
LRASVGELFRSFGEMSTGLLVTRTKDAEACTHVRVTFPVVGERSAAVSERRVDSFSGRADGGVRRAPIGETFTDAGQLRIDRGSFFTS